MFSAPKTSPDYVDPAFSAMGTKTCTKCGKTKALDAFFKAKDKPLGRQSQCKQCKKDWYLTDYQNNPEKYANRAKKWRDNNQDRVKANRKRYERTSQVRKAYLERADVKQRRRENAAAFHARNPDAASRYMRNFRQRNASDRFAHYKKKYRANLGTGYINELCVQGTERSSRTVPPEITAIKRKLIEIHRLLNQKETTK